MIASQPPDREDLHGAVLPQDRFLIFNRKNVIRLAEQRQNLLFRCAAIRSRSGQNPGEGLCACFGKGDSQTKFFAEKCAVFPWLFPGKKVRCAPEQSKGIRRFTAKGQCINTAKRIKQTDTARGKKLCAGHSRSYREFKNEICTGLQCHAGAHPFIDQRRLPALQKIGTHNDNNIVCA